MNAVEHLKKIRYPGRFIILGKDGDATVAIYGATGRSDPSLARKYARRGDEVFADSTDPAVTQKGNVELLTYPALRIFKNGFVVANARHINTIKSLRDSPAARQLEEALQEQLPEPDANQTPRITGAVVESKIPTAGLHIVRAKEGVTERESTTVPLISGQGHYVATYNGDDVRPNPSYSGAPTSVQIGFGSAQVAAEEAFDALKPPQGGMDYRVGVVAIYKKPNEEASVAIVNRLA